MWSLKQKVQKFCKIILLWLYYEPSLWLQCAPYGWLPFLFSLQLWVSLVESADFYESNFYSSSWLIEKTDFWYVPEKKMTHEGVKYIVPVVGAVWIAIKYKIPKIIAKMLSNRKQSADQIKAISVPK